MRAMLVEVTATNSFERQAARVDAVGPQDRHAVLEAAGAVRDLGEVAAAQLLLAGA